jgi:hypothetical protein
MGLPAIVERALKAFTTTNAFRATTIQEDLFVQGLSFTSSQIVVSPDQGQIDILVDPTVCACDQIVFAPLSFTADEGPITVEIYTGTTVSANGTELPAFNRRATSTNTTGMKLYSGPTVTDAGTKFSELLIPVSAVGPQITGSPTATGLPFEIDKGVLYMARIINNNGANANVQYSATWFEIYA